MIRIQKSATARSGSVYPLELPPGVLASAFQNTVALLTRAVVVDEPAPASALPADTPTETAP